MADKKRKGTENLIPMNQRTPEERRLIGLKGAETRRKKKEEKMQLQKCMRTLLNLPPKSGKRMKIMEEYGFEKGEATNKTLLMVALFQKGLTGDVQAIKEITQMMDKLDMFEDTGKVQGNITINLIPQGDVYIPNEQDEQDIWDVENNTEWMEKGEADQVEDDWGDDVY